MKSNSENPGGDRMKRKKRTCARVLELCSDRLHVDQSPSPENSRNTALYEELKEKYGPWIRELARRCPSQSGQSAAAPTPDEIERRIVDLLKQATPDTSTPPSVGGQPSFTVIGDNNTITVQLVAPGNTNGLCPRCHAPKAKEGKS